MCVYGTVWHTDPVEAGLPAELMSPRGAEVVVGPEGLVQGGDQVEQGLPAAFVAQRVVPVFTALTQPRRSGK